MQIESKPARKLPFDTCRCMGYDCPVRDNCLRYTDKAEGGHWVAFTDKLCRTASYESQIKEYAND